MKSTPLTLQQRRLVCKNVATSEGVLTEYFQIWRKSRELFPEDKELFQTTYIEQKLAKVLYNVYQDRKRRETNK